MTTRRAMLTREGTAGVEQAERLGLRVWAIERYTTDGAGTVRHQTAMVFGKSRSDALRRASVPARLGEETVCDETFAKEIVGGLDDEVIWPFEGKVF